MIGSFKSQTETSVFTNKGKRAMNYFNQRNYLWQK